jgi:thiol-disulfide isomerase/thioredoxin
MFRSTVTAATALAFCLAGGAWGQQTYKVEQGPTLTIGDKAPDFDIGHWLKGEQIEAFEDGKVYVMEFWATWCGPCVGSMPHLSELQEKYKDYDVTILAVSDEPLQTVVEFLFKTYKRDGKIHNDRTHYTLTTDPDKSVKNAYFTAAGQRGIPCSFIIGKDQHIEWIGHPMGMDDALEGVVHDTWDRATFKTKWEQEQAAERLMASQRREMMEAQKNGDWPKVMSMLDSAIEASGGDINYKAQKFMIMAKEMKQYDQAWAYAGEIVDDSWDDSMMLNQIAWFIVDEKGLEHRDLNLALRAARRASELTKDENGAILDTVANIYYKQGDMNKALKYQRKAVKHAEGPMLEELQKKLQEYEKEAGRN